MRIEPEISGVSIVLLGQFNPAIFTPAWFMMHAILPKSVEANAKLQIAHPQVTVFASDWLQLEVATDRRPRVQGASAPYARQRVRNQP